MREGERRLTQIIAGVRAKKEQLFEATQYRDRFDRRSSDLTCSTETVESKKLLKFCSGKKKEENINKINITDDLE